MSCRTPLLLLFESRSRTAPQPISFKNVFHLSSTGFKKPRTSGLPPRRGLRGQEHPVSLIVGVKKPRTASIPPHWCSRCQERLASLLAVIQGHVPPKNGSEPILDVHRNCHGGSGATLPPQSSSIGLQPDLRQGSVPLHLPSRTLPGLLSRAFHVASPRASGVPYCSS